MLLLWVACGSVLPLLGLSLGQERCGLSHGNHHHDSPVLSSLQCHNNYNESLFCDWLEDPRQPLELYNWMGNGAVLPCVPYGEPETRPGGQRAARCRLKTGLGIFAHTFFFRSPCPPQGPGPQELSERVRVRPPINLSRQSLGDGDQLLYWSSPYPATSPLTSDLNYQLSYRKDTEDCWMDVPVSDRRVRLEAASLRPGARYQARVRARGTLGLWSEWSPLLVWQTEGGEAGQRDPSSSLQCVLEGDGVVTCSWDLITEHAHFITYHLACRNNHSAPAERCCVNVSTSAAPGGSAVKYTCTLTHPDPGLLLLELIPTRNTKEFEDHKHVKPNRPEQVRVKAKDGNWQLEWTKPDSRDTLSFCYQVQHWSEKDKNASHLTTVSEGDLSLSILDRSLNRSRLYRARVRALVAPGSGFEGIPSEWSETVEWTSHPATWTHSRNACIVIGVLVTLLFLALYAIVPSCRRRVKSWDVSVPSPVKSKVIADVIKRTGWPSSSSKKERWPPKTAPHVIQPQESLDISVCSSWSSNDPFLSSKHGTHETGLHHSLSERGDWDMMCSSSLAVDEKGPLETSCMTFSSGEYFYPPGNPSEPRTPTLSPGLRGLDSSTTPDLRPPTSSTDNGPPAFSPSLSAACDDYIVLPDRSPAGGSPPRHGNGDAAAVCNRGDPAAARAEAEVGSAFAGPVQEVSPTPNTNKVFSALPFHSCPAGVAMGCESTTCLKLPVLVRAQQQIGDLQFLGCPEGGDAERRNRVLEESYDQQMHGDPYVTLKV